MKLLVIGSTQYSDKFQEVRRKLESQGHMVKLPAFDDRPDLTELGICQHNRDLILWADRVHLIWDNRSLGTVFDMGMVFMARKPLVIEYLEPKTFARVFQQYEDFSNATRT